MWCYHISTLPSPILVNFQKRAKRNIQLKWEKQIIAKDSQTGGYEEFLVVDPICIPEEDLAIPILEAKGSTIQKGMKQYLLAMRDTWDKNGEGEVYGFVTAGVDW